MCTSCKVDRVTDSGRNGSVSVGAVSHPVNLTEDPEVTNARSQIIGVS